MHVKMLGVRKDYFSGEDIVFFEARLTGYECTLIEFSLLLQTKDLYRGSKSFFKLSLEKQEALIASARELF